MDVPGTFKLSICIPTFNRADFINQTLENIVAQTTCDCEIVISDNASTDSTEEVVLSHVGRSDRVRYIKQNTNVGVDRNIDNVVKQARGEYCWLFPDDDRMKPHAVRTVLNALTQSPSLVMVNTDLMNYDFSKFVVRRWVTLDSDRSFKQDEMDQLFIELGESLWYLGSVVIKREVWLERERERYYGSLFLHVAVIYQRRLPGLAIVIADPLVSIRLGNTHSWGVGVSEVLLEKWPSLLNAMAVSPAARKKVRTTEPWRRYERLLQLRANDNYSMKEYRRWIEPRLKRRVERLLPLLVALLPQAFAKVLYTVSPRNHAHWWLNWRRVRLYIKHRSDSL